MVGSAIGSSHCAYFTMRSVERELLQVEGCYDRLGKYLHAQNPWGKGQNIQNIAMDLKSMVASAKELIAYHARFIRAPEFNGVWIVDAGTPQPTLLNAEAKGPYAVSAA